MRVLVNYITVILLFTNFAYATELESYFVSIKAKEVNLRTGPNIRYPIKLHIIGKNEPLKVINKFQHWRQVEDSENDTGWVHVSNLSSKKFVKSKCESHMSIYIQPDEKSKTIAKAESNVVFSLIECKNDWCKIEKNSTKGWALKRNLWGDVAN